MNVKIPDIPGSYFHRGFPLKIVVPGFDAGIASTLFIWCDEYRRRKTGHPRGGSIPIQKIPCPPSLGEALRRESFVEG
jgi:hypothetical protein